MVRFFRVIPVLVLACILGLLSSRALGATGDKLQIQLWDAQKTNWTDAELSRLQKAGFTVCQNGWNGSLLPSSSLLSQLQRYGLSYGAYIDTRYLFRLGSTDAEKAAVSYVTNYDGTKSSFELNSLDPIYQTVVKRELTKRMQAIAGLKGFYKAMFNSEHGAPISYDSVTRNAALRVGVMMPSQLIPVYDRGVWKVPSGTTASQYAEPYRWLRWYDNECNDHIINRIGADAVRAVDRNVRCTTDPLGDGFALGQYKKMDILQDWIRVDGAPRDPLGLVTHMERLKANRRAAGGDIWIGPQVATATATEKYAAPADAFEESMWLALGFGAKGLTFWGYNGIRWTSALDQDTWSRIPKVKNAVAGTYSFVLDADDAPRDVAVLMSKANQIFSGQAYYRVEENYDNFYRCLLSAHVPADVVYDDEVLIGELRKYKALFLPGISKLTPELDREIALFQQKGGRVIRWPVLLPLYRDYEVEKGNYSESIDVNNPGGKTLLPNQYRYWRHQQAAKMYAAVQDLMTVKCDNPNVIINVLGSGAARALVVINDSRTYGAWTTERGAKICEDKGLAATANITLPTYNGGSRTIRVSLPPAGIEMIYF